MNILFLLKTLDVGGLEVVTAVLANKFLNEGHRVSVFAFEEGSGLVRNRFSQHITMSIGQGFQMSDDNVELLRTILTDNEVDVVINQWGLPLIPIRTLNKARKGLKAKVISVYHNDPLQNGRIQSVATEMVKTQGTIRKTMLRFKRFAFRCVTGYAMRYNYLHSDVFEVLSPSFVAHFQTFTKLGDTPKLVVQTNPVTIDTDGFAYQSGEKKKEIVFVGRLDYTQKRVHRVIETWAQLEHRFPDWRLTIVGDGEERENLEQMVRDLELHSVYFEGFQHPRAYYERASMLILTSEFEGFPLVLAECMSFGVVPVVYGSYSAVYDIIEDGKDGFIIPKTAEGFNAAVMAAKMADILATPEKMQSMSLVAIEKSKNYSIEKIYEQWTEVITRLK